MITSPLIHPLLYIGQQVSGPGGVTTPQSEAKTWQEVGNLTGLKIKKAQHALLGRAG